MVVTTSGVGIDAITSRPVSAPLMAVSMVSASRDLAQHDHVGILPERGADADRQVLGVDPDLALGDASSSGRGAGTRSDSRW